MINFCFPLSSHPQTVVDHYITEIINAAIHFIEPGSSSCEGISGTDIEHQETVDVANQGFVIQVGGEQLGMARTHATVTGDIEVPEDAMPGLTYMRVFKLYDSYTSDPCSSEDGYGYGQVENYLINVSDGDCNLEAPEIDEDIMLCNMAEGDDLPTDEGEIVWYHSAAGDDIVTSDELLVTGTYYAAAIEGLCESEERTAVMVMIDETSVDAMQDVFACTSYMLPELVNGSYYSGANGTGAEYEAGDEITETTTLYVYAESETVEGCFAEVSFTVNINTLSNLVGENEQTFADGATIADIVVEGETDATIAWYATIADAEAGTNSLNLATLLTDGTTYYAVQTFGECASEIFPVAVTLGTTATNDFASKGFTYYPNPVTTLLTINYSTAITNITVYNLMGQQVLSRDNTLPQAVTDMSALSAGTYLVKVTAGTQTTTLKIVKQ